MRISIEGDTGIAKVLRGYATAAGLHLTNHNPTYSVIVEEGAGPNIVIDGINCRFKEAVQNAVSELSDTRIEYQRAGGVQSDRKIRIVGTGSEADADAIERGVLRALLIVTGRPQPKKNIFRFWR
jgi:hypothetical protein